MPYSILIVDDDITIRQMLSVHLAKNYSVFAAESADASMKVLAKNRIDCTLLDVVMPDKSGIEVLKEMRQTYPEIPVIMITGHGDADLVDQCIKYGAAGYLNKPFSMENIAFEIEKAVDTATAKDELEKKVEERTANLKKEIAERKEIEEQLRQRVESEKIVASLSPLFITPDLEDIDNSINHALKVIGEFCKVDRSYVLLLHDHEGEKKIENTYEWNADGIEHHVEKRQELNSA